jgi:hypothetical protein
VKRPHSPCYQQQSASLAGITWHLLKTKQQHNNTNNTTHNTKQQGEQKRHPQDMWKLGVVLCCDVMCDVVLCGVMWCHVVFCGVGVAILSVLSCAVLQ